MPNEMSGKDLVAYNCKNAHYAIKDAEGKWAVKKFAKVSAVALEANVTSAPIYGDGEIQYTVYNDSGRTITITATARDLDYEKDLKLVEILDGDLIADVEQLQSVDHCIGYEYNKITYGDAGEKIKVTTREWAFNGTVAKPSRTLNQSTENLNQNGVDYVFSSRGELKQGTDGKPFVDADGNEQKVFVVSCSPSSPQYKTFFSTVPIPKIKEE